MNNKKNHINTEKEFISLINRTKITLVYSALGLLFPVGAWLFDLINSGLNISLQSVIDIHHTNPLHYLFDLSPFLFAIVGFVIGSRIDQQYTRNKKLFETQDQNFRVLLDFSEKIGMGDYNAELNVQGSDDIAKILVEMRDKLKGNAKLEQERNWIMKGVAEIGTILREHDDLDELSFEVIKFVIGYLDAVQGAFYVLEEGDDGEDNITMRARYAYNRKKYQLRDYKVGIGLIGQCAFEKDIVHRTEIPEDYVSITSGLVKDKKPNSILLVPLLTDQRLFGVMEFASISKFTEEHIKFVKEISDIIARTIFNIGTNETTRRLLEESQQMSTELQEQQVILQNNAVEMEKTQDQLKKQFEAVENQQKRQHALLAKSSEIITIYDKDGVITFQSPSVESILGYTPAEMVGENDFYRMNPAGEKAVQKMFDSLIVDSDQHLVAEYMYVKKDGKRVWLESTARNLLADPAIKGIVFNSRDITLRRKAEREEAMRGKMQALSENSQDIIMRYDLNGKLLYVNPKLQFYTGARKKDTEGKTLSSLSLHESIKDGWLEILETVKKEHKIISQEVDFPTEEEKLIMMVNAIPEYDKSNKLETVLLVSHDITSRKKQELIIQETNRKITDSINYAKRIQHAIIPIREDIEQDLKEFFMFYKPKDVVSGDFPWYYKKDDLIYFAAVDCTGHGVPGAMMSLIGFLLLNDIVNDIVDWTPSEILDRLNIGVVETLKQHRKENSAADGMDVAICRIDLKNNELQYAGAHRPLYFVRNGELTQYKGDKYAIGGRQYKGDARFTNHSIKLEKEDSVFFFSDGLPDQFGGPENFKFGPKRIRETIVEHHNKPMNEIGEIFESKLEDWMVDQPQFDDVLLIGIRF